MNDKAPYSKLLCGKTAGLYQIIDFEILQRHQVVSAIITDSENKLCNSCARMFVDTFLPPLWQKDREEQAEKERKEKEMEMEREEKKRRCYTRQNKAASRITR